MILIWGMIIYRVVEMTGKPEAISFKSKETFEKLPIKQVERQALSLDYQDPFGLEIEKSKSAKRKNTRARTRSRNKVHWPELKYIGLVDAKSTGKKITIVSIEQKQHFFELDQTLEDVKLLKVWNDSIRVSYQDSLIKVVHK